MKILLTGATGLIGRELGKELVRLGHELIVVSRDKENAQFNLPFPAQIIEGDLSQEPLRDDHLNHVEAVIHLAGENLAGGRWTAARKQRIYDSRVKSTQNLIASLSENRALKTLISASAIGFYGDCGDQALNESSPRGPGFLSEVCQDWEQPVLLADRKALFPQCRTVTLRISMVLSNRGGALAAMKLPLRFGALGRIGKGNQWTSWIHLQDLVQLILLSINDSRVRGLINAVAPEPVRQRQFVEQLTRISHHRMGPPVPDLVFQLALGEMSQVLLHSQKVHSEVLPQLNFKFRFPTIHQALEEVCKHWKSGDDFYFAEQYLPYAPEAVFPFFSEAKNLGQITPSQLDFKILEVSTQEMGTGTLIRYRLKVHGIALTWVTEIKNWKPPQNFEDIQRKGPYSKWHHQHVFEKMGSGTLMTDQVNYKLPFGFLGDLCAGRWVRKDLQSIFDFRKQAIQEIKFKG